MNEFEAVIADQLRLAGVPFVYEGRTIRFTTFDGRQGTYMPDFALFGGTLIEVKGWFDSRDRRKHRLIREQHPHLDIRIVFSDSSRCIGDKSATTLARWCEWKGIKYADRIIPAAWLAEFTERATKSFVPPAARGLEGEQAQP